MPSNTHAGCPCRSSCEPKEAQPQVQYAPRPAQPAALWAVRSSSPTYPGSPFCAACGAAQYRPTRSPRGWHDSPWLQHCTPLRAALTYSPAPAEGRCRVLGGGPRGARGGRMAAGLGGAAVLLLPSPSEVPSGAAVRKRALWGKALGKRESRSCKVGASAWSGMRFRACELLPAWRACNDIKVTNAWRTSPWCLANLAWAAPAASSPRLGHAPGSRAVLLAMKSGKGFAKLQTPLQPLIHRERSPVLQSNVSPRTAPN